MHSAAPLQLRVNRYGLWRAAVLSLALSACAAMLAWTGALPAPVPPWAAATAAIGALASFACGVGLWRMQPLTLRWDRERWFVARDDAAEQACDLAVAIDCGGWLLLRLVPAGTEAVRAWRHRVLWIALQRRGLEAQWHALRCAVYAARSALAPRA
jgi:hypothetical protein